MALHWEKQLQFRTRKKKEKEKKSQKSQKLGPSTKNQSITIAKLVSAKNKKSPIREIQLPAQKI